MSCYVFSAEPTGSLYEDLVEFCCSIASQMILVVRDQHPQIDEALSALSSDLVKVERTSEWPGTVLSGDQASVHWYAVTPDLQERLKSAVAGLFDWVGVKPEDPCFFRADGKPLLVTTSHEHDAYLFLSESEHLDLQRRFPGLTSLLRQELDGPGG